MRVAKARRIAIVTDHFSRVAFHIRIGISVNEL